MKRSAMKRRRITRVLARKLALRFTLNMYEPGCGEMHLKLADCTATFDDGTVKGMAYWPVGGGVLIVSISGESNSMPSDYRLPVSEIVEAALRWHRKRNEPRVASPLLPEDPPDPTDGSLGDPGMSTGPLAPPEMP